MMQRTKRIEFSRQLWPQPPAGSVPYWCYINTLMFKDPDTHETVWEQEIPECALIKKMNRFGHVDTAEKRFTESAGVEYEEHWGWILKLVMSHTEAEQVWSFVMNDLDYTRLGHYEYEKEGYPPQTRYAPVA